jgi:predicted DNA-binding protein
MATCTERVQTVVTRAQYEALNELAQRTQKPISVLIREAVEATYFVEREHRLSAEALEQLLALQATVADWGTMEEEIERAALG